MEEKSNKIIFMRGLLIGALIYLIVWYWQKSTSAEDGALEMLDRLAEQEAELARLRVQAAVSPPIATPTRSVTTAVPPFLDEAEFSSDVAEDLTQIKGVGTVFAAKLREAGLQTITAVAAVEAERLATLLEIGDKRAAAILDEAKKSSNQ